LSSKTGETFAFEAMIYCVSDWQTSPFVKINPDRVALVGRDLLLTLKPMILLDFNERQTEIGPSRTAFQARRKRGSNQKKRSSQSRRRH
jgi:hypothetical protein